MIRDWPGERQARELRHWPTLIYLAERVARSEHLDALIVIGSFAKVEADEASGLDLLIAPGTFGLNLISPMAHEGS